MSNRKCEKRSSKREWIKLALAYNLKQFNELAEMIYRWYNPIKKGFETGLTNGYTEGINNKIKVVLVYRDSTDKKRIIYLGANN